MIGIQMLQFVHNVYPNITLHFCALTNRKRCSCSEGNKNVNHTLVQQSFRSISPIFINIFQILVKIQTLLQEDIKPEPNLILKSHFFPLALI